MPKHGCDDDVGMADPVAEPEIGEPLGAVGFERDEHADDLRAAAGDEEVGFRLMQAHLVEQAHRLVGEAAGKRRDLQCPAALRLGDWKHAPLGRDEAVEIVQDGVAFDQHLAVIEDQRRHTRQRVVGANLVGVAEGRPRTVLERHFI